MKMKIMVKYPLPGQITGRTPASIPGSLAFKNSIFLAAGRVAVPFRANYQGCVSNSPPPKLQRKSRFWAPAEGGNSKRRRIRGGNSKHTPVQREPRVKSWPWLHRFTRFPPGIRGGGITDAEESGLRGARAFVKENYEKLIATPHYNYNMDSLFSANHLIFLTSDINNTVKLSKNLAEKGIHVAEKLGYTAEKMNMPFGGGATDAGEFAKV